MKTIDRNYRELSNFIDMGESVIVLGPRGSGKTFYLEALIKKKPNHITFNLLETSVYTKYVARPALLADEILTRVASLEDNAKLHCFIDEIQRVPDLLNEIQRIIDICQDRIVFILTGSSARKLKTSNANLLAGRAISFGFFPLSLDEISVTNQFELSNILQWGTLPKAYLHKSEVAKKAFLQTYTDVYLDQEIKGESEIRNLGAFTRFLELAAIENGNPVNFSKIGRASGNHPNTVKEYFNVLADTLIATAIPAWSTELRVQLQQAPKYYFFDNGVLNSLTKNLSSQIVSSSYRYGALFENLVINELIRTVKRQQLEVGIYHYRDAKQKEIDLIIQRNPFSAPVAIEIKSAVDPQIPLRHRIRTIKKTIPNSKSMVICGNDQPFTKEGLEFWPIVEGIQRAVDYAMSDE